MNSDSDSAGAPLPDLRATGIQLQTIAPAIGVLPPNLNNTPDYLDYDTKGRGIVVTMFSNAGVSYLLGVSAGGLYGFYQGVKSTPSTRFRVQLNSVLNHCGRYGSRAGNTLGVFSVMYSLYEGLADQVSHSTLPCHLSLHCTHISHQPFCLSSPHARLTRASSVRH
jgi:Tim17/Tim22/Tim23/Pmp24 family